MALALAAYVLGAPPAAADDGRVPLPADTGSAPAGAVDQGKAEGAQKIRVYLAGRDPAGLRAFAHRVSDPDDPQYEHFLTPGEYSARFGPARAQQSAVTSWLRGCGLDITTVGDHYVGAEGDSDAVGCATGTSVHEYRWHGRSLRALAGSASLPRAVSQAVLTVSGLSTLTPTVRPAATSTCSTYFGQNPATTLPNAYGTTAPWHVCGYTPSQLRSAYGTASTGLTGAGSRIAVVGAFASATIAGDSATYAANHGEQGWADSQFTQVVPDGLPPQPATWIMEETMDIEAVHAMAPGADVVYVAAAGTSDDDFIDALIKITDGHLADIVSNSWLIGADTGVPAIAAFQQVFLQGAAEGIGFGFASGDDGSQAASADGSGPLQTGTNYPASDPWVTAVGGTSLAVSSTNAYQWETGYETDYAPLADDQACWTELPGHFAGGAGGGPSGVFARPDYQHKTVPSNAFKLSGTARRVIPDVAMDADPVTGMRVGQTFNLPTGSVFAEYASGGTSLATPLFAGVQALAQQHAGHPLGFANPALYAAGSGAFRDIPALPAGAHPNAVHVLTSIGNDGTITNTFVLASLGRAQDTGLAVTAGYDAVTGLGSPTSRYVTSSR